MFVFEVNWLIISKVIYIPAWDWIQSLNCIQFCYYDWCICFIIRLDSMTQQERESNTMIFCLPLIPNKSLNIARCCVILMQEGKPSDFLEEEAIALPRDDNAGSVDLPQDVLDDECKKFDENFHPTLPPSKTKAFWLTMTMTMKQCQRIYLKV